VVEKRLAPSRMLASAGELRQILSNILANAIDALPSGGRLALKLSEGREHGESRRHGIRITVADSGCGIQPLDQQKVFEPFWTTKQDVGTGLGLWVTRSLVIKNGGSIRLRSRVTAGRSGTIVSIFFPNSNTSSEREAVKNLSAAG